MSLARRSVPVAAAVLAPVLFPAVASAHHAMGGRLPATPFEGLFSGVAHPVIGLDHLLAVLALGALCSRVPKGLFALGAFLLASLVGTGVHVAKVDLPAAEIVIAVSVVAFGALLVAGWRGAAGALIAAAAIAGLFHGYAYGESIVGAEPTPLVGYLLGFTAVQALIALGGHALARTLAARPAPSLVWSRTWGAATALVGVFFLVKAMGI